MQRHQSVATAIAETQLAILATFSWQDLAGMIGEPAHILIMGRDQQPYHVTALVLPHPDGTLSAHVSVDGDGWDHGVAVIRAAVLPVTRP